MRQTAMFEALPTRALSLIQPWAWAVVYAGKSIENRTWWTSIRGPLWIASSATTSRRYYDQASELIRSIAQVEVPPLRELTYGAIIGRASIVGCILPGGYWATTDADGREAKVKHSLGQPLKCPRHPLHPHRWHFEAQYGYVLEEVSAVTPVPCKGHQRWWTVPDSLLRQLGAAA